MPKFPDHGSRLSKKERTCRKSNSNPEKGSDFELAYYLMFSNGLMAGVENMSKVYIGECVRNSGCF